MIVIAKTSHKLKKDIIKVNLVALLVMIFISPSIVTAQVYLEGIAPPQVDSLRSNASKEVQATNYERAILLYDSLLHYWEGQLLKSNSKEVLQNLYYSKIVRYEPKHRIRQVDQDDLRAFYKLEQEIEEINFSNKSVLRFFYSLASKLKLNIEKDYRSAISYGEQAIAILTAEDSIQYRLLAIQKVVQGNAYTKLKKFDESKVAYEESLDIRLDHLPKDTLGLITGYYSLGLNYFRSKKYERSVEYFEMGFEIAKNSLPKTHDNYIALVRALGVLKSALGDVQNALRFSFYALESAKTKGETSEVNLNYHYETISGIYHKLGHTSKADTYIDSAITIIENSSTNNRLAACYSNKANFQLDLEKSITLNKKALELCPQDPDCNDAAYNTMLGNLGAFYQRKGDLETGLNYMMKSKNLKEEDFENYGYNLDNTYRAIGMIHEELNDFTRAIEFQKKAVSSAKYFRPDTSHYVAAQNASLGNLYIAIGNYTEAENILLEAKSVLENSVGSFNSDLIHTYNCLSELYIKTEKYQLARHYSKLAYENVVSKAANTNEEIITPAILLARSYGKLGIVDSSKYYLSDLLRKNGFKPFEPGEINKYEVPAQDKWFSYQSLTKMIYLEEEILANDQEYLTEKILTCIKLIDEIRQDFFFQSSEQQFQKTTKTFFNWAINKLIAEYRTEESEEVLSLLFKCMEKSKSVTINRDFIRYQAHNSLALPEKVIKREKDLILQHESAYKKYESNIENDSLSAIYIDKMYVLQKVKSKFLDSLRNEHPKYFLSRYDQSVTTLDKIKEHCTNEDQTILMHHWADSVMYQLIVSPSSIQIEIIKTIELSKKIELVNVILKEPISTTLEKTYFDTKKKFEHNARWLFEVLLNNYTQDSLTHKLIVIPDGRLVGFPFDILLTEVPEENSNYKSLPYLIKQHSVNYIGSATQHMTLLANDNNYNSQEYTGFAPKYTQSATQDSLDQYRSSTNLSPLLYNFDEVTNASNLFNGIEYLGENATEHMFRNIEKRIGILHLAMHTSIDDKFPLDSHLNFSRENTQEDSKLYIHEIARMNLAYDLVVLSACETNKSKEDTGEGILGIARAFQIASCPNLVVSNWLIDDRSAGEIIYSFFKGIKANLSPAKSLRDAKLEFLEKSSTIKSHPSYWAGFSYYGNPTLTTNDKTNSKVLIFGGIVFFLICLIPFLMKRKIH